MSGARVLRSRMPSFRWLRQALTLAGLVAVVTTIGVAPGAAAVAHAQGGMDLEILSPSFRDLPSSVRPGEELTINAVTANGARCGGWIVFRNLPPVELENQAAPAGVCSWTVTVPPTVRHGTANIGVEITRSGQSWALYGITFVTPIGEER